MFKDHWIEICESDDSTLLDIRWLDNTICLWQTWRYIDNRTRSYNQTNNTYTLSWL